MFFRKIPFIPIFLCALHLLVQGCATPDSVHQNESQAQHTPAVTRGQPNADLEKLFWQRMEDQRANYTQADVNFMHGMIPHHAQALIMSGLAKKNEASPAIKRLAARIINAQQDEIASMQIWLRDRVQPVPLVRINGLDLKIEWEIPETTSKISQEILLNAPRHGTHGSRSVASTNHSEMPGMLTNQQLRELAAANGDNFDILFLSFMISHHEGAVFMVNELFSADGAATDWEAYALATEIYAEQVTEIHMMQKMLEDFTTQRNHQ